MLGENELIISNIEQQIAFKKIVLKSQKDVEDATHLEIYFKEKINKEKLKHYEQVIIDEYET